jgi:hypothetical protein
MEPADVLTEFSGLLDSFELNDEEVRKHLTGILRSMLDESYWQSLEEQPLINLLFEGIVLYGRINWEPIVPVIAPVYLHAMEHVSVEMRNDLQVAIREKAEANRTSLNALLPFIFLETDSSVISTAALDFSMIGAPPDDDPLDWPRKLISYLQAGTPSNLGAVLGALVTLGDRRVNELLRETKWLLSDSEIGAAAECVSGMPSVAAVEFWLEWLEELMDAGLDDTKVFGQVAAGLLLLAARMKVDTFGDITRNFGYLHNEGDEGKSMVIHGRYSKEEVGRRYADRFYALEETETVPKLLSDVIREYGLEPKASPEDRFTMQ